MTTFKDHFSNHAQDYAKYRPTYPKEFFEYLNTLCHDHHTVWDCATGNGQTALALTPYFENIIATDASAEQIHQAKPHTKITYKVCTAEETPFANNSFDLITVSQAIHWFDLDRFYKEAKRILKPQGILAAWGYFFASVTPKIDAIVENYWKGLADSWPEERGYVNSQYQTLPFPLNTIKVPQFYIKLSWTASDYCHYLKTWSGTQRYINAHGSKFFEDTQKQILEVWQNPHQTKEVRWPMIFRIGRFD